MAQNKEYNHGYNMGYDWVRYEGGNGSYAYAEIRRRGLNPRTTYGVAFIRGAKDAQNFVERRY